MVADIGTKPLTAARFEFLKIQMGMGKLEKIHEAEVEEKKEEKKEQDGQETTKEKKRIAEAAQILRLITLAASIAVTKAEEDEEAEEAFSFEVILIYTMVIIIFTLAAQRLWDVAVRGAMFMRQRVVAQLGSLPMKAAENEEKETSQGDLPEHLSGPSSSGDDRNQRDAPLPISSAPLPDGVSQDAPLPEEFHDAPQPDAPQPSGTQPESSYPAIDLTEAHALLRAHDESMVDYEREWNEIEMEERRVRAELNAALPGDPILGPATSQPESPPLPELSFEMMTTRHGTVYHSDRNCRYLTAPKTGAVKIHKWCAACRMRAAQTGIIPGHGAAVLTVGWRLHFHTDITCAHAEGANSFSLCTACLEVA